LPIFEERGKQPDYGASITRQNCCGKFVACEPVNCETPFAPNVLMALNGKDRFGVNSKTSPKAPSKVRHSYLALQY
jgi:hypothetical protein